MGVIDHGPAGSEPTGRASVCQRLLAVAMGVSAACFGATAPWLVPEYCRVAGWAALVLFVPVGCGGVFFGVRGREADLGDLSARKIAGELVGALILGVIIGAMIGLLSVLW